jgi:hypothetical protein
MTIEKDRERMTRRLRQSKSQLESPPHRSVQQLSVVSRGDRYDVTRQQIDLH